MTPFRQSHNKAMRAAFIMLSRTVSVGDCTEKDERWFFSSVLTEKNQAQSSSASPM
jgi:hypothetical protein